MPHLFVPFTHQRSNKSNHSNNHKVKISYSLRGHGSVLVVLLPGMCAPASMYDAMASVLAATSQFTTVAIDNRGIGSSHVPPASHFRAPAYSTSQLAHDAWHVIDHVISSPSYTPYHPQVALIGHSMGGMILQRMLALRPHRVRYVALLSTHAGGLWNMLPTLRLFFSALRIAWSGFDPHVNATENLNLHFTQRFLDDHIVIDDFHPTFLSSRRSSQPQPQPLHNFSTFSHTTTPTSIHPTTIVRKRRHSHSSFQSIRPSSTAHQDSPVSHDDDGDDDDDDVPPSTFYRGLNFVESKVLEFARDAHLYFGLSVASLPEKFRHPKQFLLDSIVSRARRYQTESRRRWDIYHARYTGLDMRTDTNTDEHKHSNNTQPSSTSSSTSKQINVEHLNVNNNRSDSTSTSTSASTQLNCEKCASDFSSKPFSSHSYSTTTTTTTTNSNTNTNSTTNTTTTKSSMTNSSQKNTSVSPTEIFDEPASMHTYAGHLAVVRSHYLPKRFAHALRDCRSIIKLVVIGRHDSVIPPSASRALAASIGANTVVEVEAAHFVTDEAAAEITTHIIYGLRKAFFAPVTTPCACDWCLNPPRNDDGTDIDTDADADADADANASVWTPKLFVVIFLLPLSLAYLWYWLWRE